MSQNTVGFIILRHVNNKRTNQYWQKCYDCIRQFYPENTILIIDDNSNYLYISDKALYKTIIINSEYHQRGELLPYYYYLKNNLFDTAVIIHDSVFIQHHINIQVKTYKILWGFDHHWENNVNEELTMMSVLNNNQELLDFYNDKTHWKGCFGGMSIIAHNYLTRINAKHDISKLLDVVINRDKRGCFERVIYCLLQKEFQTESLFGFIDQYMVWGTTFEMYNDNKYLYAHLPMIKVWTGR
jgi:hypothetical protein